MSFILDDKDLINQLLKHGWDFDAKFTKSGQVAAAQANASAAMKQLLDNLDSQLNPQLKDPNAPADVSTESDSPISLTSTALEGLGALVAFLAQNKITVNGQRVSYYQQEDPKSEDYQLYRLEPGAGFLEPATRETVTNGYFVNKDLLVKYVVTLQAGLAKKPNDVLRVQLGALVNQANKLLGTKISDTYQAPEPSLADNQLVDSLPKDIKTQFPTQGGGVPLYYADIKSLQALNAWIDKNSVSVDGRMENHPQFNKCGLIQSMHARAQQLLGNARDDKQTTMYKIYSKQVETISSSVKGCTLSGTSPAPDAGTGAATADSLSRLVSALPLAAGDIDFSRIRTFFDMYRQMVNPNRPGAAAAIRAMDNVVNTAMPNAQKMTENQMDSYPLSVDATTLGTWLIAPKGMTQANSLINNLRYVVAETAAVVRDVKNAYQQQLKQYPQLEAAIIGQIGEDAESAGFAGVNLNHLDLWSKGIAAQPQNSSSTTPPGWKARGY